MRLLEFTVISVLHRQVDLLPRANKNYNDAAASASAVDDDDDASTLDKR